MVLKRRILPGIAMVMIVLVLGSGVVDMRLWPQDKESLLFEDIPVVVTASRKEQPITEAPTTISVITADDIRYSGAATIPDLLRMVAGIDVMAISARDQQVGARGFMDLINNKLLVQVDGHSVYINSTGYVIWNLIPVSLAEIERIEVIKSPSSSLYGANAFSGIISIITKSPEQLNGTTLGFTGGSRDTITGSLLHAGHMAGKKIRYKMSTEWDQTNEWGENKRDAARILRMNAYVEFKPGEKSKLVLSGGRSRAKDLSLLFSGELGPVIYEDTTHDYLQLEAVYSNLKFRTLMKSYRSDFSAESGYGSSSHDTELSHLFHIGGKHSLLWGFNYTFNQVKKNIYFRENYRQHRWAVFFEDEIIITGKTRLTLGLRYDRHPLVGGRFSPKGNLLYSPASNHFIRLSVAQAHRVPTMFDSYFSIGIPLQLSLSPPLPPVDIPFTFLFHGNQSIDPERIIAYEVGYHGTWSKHLKFNLNLYYNRYSDFFTDAAMFSYYGENELFPGSPGGVLPKAIVITLENGRNGRGIGGETGFDFLINQGISGFINYSFQQLTETDDPSTPQVIEENQVRTQYPKHKLNAGFRVLFKNGFSFNLLAHWVDKTRRRISDGFGNSYLAAVDDYFLVNTRAGYTSRNEKIELALSIFNLFNDLHYEYPTPPGLSFPTSEPVGRRFTVTVRYKFK
ncbi:MAG: TonB-dependent receptor [bacterium]|nr:TonB-dependent receptor [bacterium]